MSDYPMGIEITARQMSLGVVDSECPGDAPAFVQRLSEELPSIVLDHPEVVSVRLIVVVEMDPDAVQDDDTQAAR